MRDFVFSTQRRNRCRVANVLQDVQLLPNDLKRTSFEYDPDSERRQTFMSSRK